MDWAKTTARWYENHLSFVICWSYIRDIPHVIKRGARTAMEGILPKGPYPPCLRMVDRALLAGYPRNVLTLSLPLYRAARMPHVWRWRAPRWQPWMWRWTRVRTSTSTAVVTGSRPPFHHPAHPNGAPSQRWPNVTRLWWNRWDHCLTASTLYVLNFSEDTYKQFMSFLHFGMTQVAEIMLHVRQEPAYST